MKHIGRFIFHLLAQSTFVTLAQCCGTDYCPECLPAKIHDAPGVGFDIGFSYGVSAVHFYNGTITDVATTRAKPDYVALMKRLANSPEPPPPSKYRRFVRWLNKKRGLPATPDVGILSSLIAELYKATQSAYPSIEIGKVVVSSPLIPALPMEDLNDAIEFAGLSSWHIESPEHLGVLGESKAATAASGIGLCKSYTIFVNCIRECWEEGWKNVYFIMFTQQELYTSINGYMYSFMPSGAYGEDYIFDTDLGFSHLGDFSNSSEFWERIRSQLLFLPGNTTAPITDVVLAGESAHDPTFLQVLGDALAEIVPQKGSAPERRRLHKGSLTVDVDRVGALNPLFAAARGAALYARWRQQAQFFCEEDPVRCKRERMRERKGRNLTADEEEDLTREECERRRREGGGQALFLTEENVGDLRDDFDVDEELRELEREMEREGMIPAWDDRDELRDELRGELKEELREELIDELRDELIDELRDELREELRNELRNELRDELRNELRDELR